MALRAVPEHPKFSELQVRLNLEKFEALGILESVWHFTGRFAPQGNIGKYSNEAIAKWIGWKGNPAALIEALVEAGWLDKHDSFRLITHDWHNHADHATRLALKRAKQDFCRSVVGPLDAHVGPLDAHDPPAEGLPEAGAGAGAEAGAGKKTKAPAKAKKPPLPDPRFTPFRHAFEDNFKAVNGVPAPWDAKESTNLSRWLKANPTITQEQWLRILYNRHISPLNQKASLSVWIAKALAWLDGKADEWGKPLKEGNGNGYVNRAQQRTNSNIENVRRAAAACIDEELGGLGGGAPGDAERGNRAPVLSTPL